MRTTPQCCSPSCMGPPRRRKRDNRCLVCPCNMGSEKIGGRQSPPKASHTNEESDRGQAKPELLVNWHVAVPLPLVEEKITRTDKPIRWCMSPS